MARNIQSRAAVAHTDPGMRMVLRTDLGGRATALTALTAMGDIEITAPVVVLTGANGCGKSSLLAALRQGTGLVGPGIGEFVEHQGLWTQPLPFPWREGEPVDIARHALLVSNSREYNAPPQLPQG